MVWQRLDDGERMAEALGNVVRLAASTAGGRLNLLLTDGASIAATTWGDTLSWRADESGVVVASEPYDDGPGWVDVPDRSLLAASPRRGRRDPTPAGRPPGGPVDPLSDRLTLTSHLRPTSSTRRCGPTWPAG